MIARASACASSTIRSASRFACVLQLVRGPLGRDERRAQQRLELAVAGELRLELLDPVGELGPLAPDALEARCDLLEQLVDRPRR